MVSWRAHTQTVKLTDKVQHSNYTGYSVTRVICQHVTDLDH